MIGVLSVYIIEGQMYNSFFSVSEDLDGAGGEEYPMDIWLLLASYIRPEDIVNFSLICKNAWTVTCTAAFWTRLYRRCDHRDSLCYLCS